MVNDKDELQTDDPFEYGFNEEGFPCHVIFRHGYNQVKWEGFYSYSDTEFEYVEFCLNTGIPSEVTTIKFNQGKNVSLQSNPIEG